MSSESCSECDGYETVIVDGEEVHCATCSLRAEVERLRAALAVIQYEADIIGDSDDARIYIDLLNDIWKMAHNALPVIGGPS